MSASVNGGLFDQLTLSTIHTRSALRRRAAFALSRKQTLGLQEIMKTINGAAAGSTAAKTLGRIEANTELGGLRTVETQTLVSRVTVAGDLTDVAADILTHTSYDGTPPVNLDQNPLGTR